MPSLEIMKPTAGSLANDQARALRSWIRDRRVLQLPGWLSVAPALRSVGTGLRLSESRR